MGGDIGGLGGRSPKFEVGDGPCIRPPIFPEVVLLEAWQSTNIIILCVCSILFYMYITLCMRTQYMYECIDYSNIHVSMCVAYKIHAYACLHAAMHVSVCIARMVIGKVFH